MIQRSVLTVCTALLLTAHSSMRADVVVVHNDEEFIDTAGAVQIINFVDLQDGSPSYDGAEITPDYNYDLYGAHFSDPLGLLALHQREGLDFELASVGEPPAHTWIDVTLTDPARAVAILFDDETSFEAFDAKGNVLIHAHPPHEAGSPRHEDHLGFLGVVSDIPIASIRIDRDAHFEAIHGFLFTPVPEPGTCMLLFCAFAMTCFGRRR